MMEERDRVLIAASVAAVLGRSRVREIRRVDRKQQRTGLVRYVPAVRRRQEPIETHVETQADEAEELA